MSEKFTEYDYGNDARFETFRDFRKNKQLYQNHKDIAKDYDKKTRFYRSCQKWYCLEWNRQIHNTKERFSKLIGRTYTASQTKSKYLQYSYNKWVNPVASRDNVHEGKCNADSVCNGETPDEDDLCLQEVSRENNEKRRVQSVRSVSVANVENKVQEVRDKCDSRLSVSVQGQRSRNRHFHNVQSMQRCRTIDLAG